MNIIMLMLGVFIVITIGVGLTTRGANKTINGFVLGGRKIGPYLTAFAYGTSYFSAVVFVGYAGQFGFRFGISAIWIGIGNAIIGSLLAWVVLARRTRIMTNSLKSATMPDFFGKRFDSQSIKTAASLIAFVFLIPYTASLYNGLSRLFAIAFNVDFVVCIIAMATITAIYVIVGGYTATAVNDFIQGIIMLLGIVVIIAAVLRVNGGFISSMDMLANVTDETVTTTPGAFTSIFGPKPLDLLGVVLLTSLGTWGLPQMVQKYYSIKSEKNITTGTVVSTIFALIVSGGCYFLGGFGRLFSPNTAAYDSIIPSMVSGFESWLIGIVIVLVFAASISTLSSLVMNCASTFALDFVRLKKSEREQLLIIRVLIAVFIVISAVVAIVQYRGSFSFIAQMMGVSWGALAGAFLAPFLYGIYMRGVTRAAVWVNFVFAIAVMLVNVFFKSSLPAFLQSPINCGAFVMIAGLVLVPIVSAVTPKLSPSVVSSCFSCFDEEVPVKVREHLRAEE